ncbi:MAG: peptidoglycan DD-metalloendopeptidase family protein [Emcibacteraceae bacterium]
MKIDNVIKWLSEKADRYYPDRQLYFRTNGDVKFITISQKVQIGSSLFLFGFAIWFLVASYNYVYITEIIDEKNGEVKITSQNYQELEAQYNQLKNDIQKSATALEQRQQYIQQVLEEDGNLTKPSTQNPAFDNSSSNDEDYDDDADQQTRNMIRDKDLDKIYVGLKRIEMQQNTTVKMMMNKVDKKLAFLEGVLDNAGINSDKMLELADDLPSAIGQGGPFIGLEGGINDASIDSGSFDELYNKRENLNNLEVALSYLPIATPPEKYYISSKFGMRRDPITKKWAQHKGLDMAGWHKTPIRAGGPGIVARAGRFGTFGLYVEIDHGNGFRSKYGHLSQVKVKKGEKVTENQLIGLMGSTGRAVSTHLHYEIWFNGKPLDPLKVLKAAKDVQKIRQQSYDS